MIHLGVDLGSKRIGLAISDAGGGLAFPLAVLQARSRAVDVQAVAAEVRKADARCVVVGLPLNMDDSEGEMAKNARRFAERLQRELGVGVAVTLVDERLSSFAADDALNAQPARATSSNDAQAAAVFLQQFLNDRVTPPTS